MIKYTMLALAGLVALAYLAPKTVLVYVIATGKVNWLASAVIILIESVVIGWIIDKVKQDR